MRLFLLSLSSLCVLMGSGGWVSAVEPGSPEPIALPHAFVSNAGDALRFGQAAPVP